MMITVVEEKPTSLAEQAGNKELELLSAALKE